MTARRNLKKLIRERLARTGEHYMTARRHILGQRDETGIEVLELEDLSAEGAQLGFRCKVLMYPELAERVDRSALLVRIRDALRETGGDPATEQLRSVALEGQKPWAEERSAIDLSDEGARFIARARAGIGGVSESGRMLALPVAGRHGLEIVVCLLWPPPFPNVAPREPALVLSRPAGLGWPFHFPRMLP